MSTKLEITKWNKSKKKKRGTAIRSQKILSNVMELIGDGYDKEDIVIRTGLTPATYDYYLNKINKMYLERYQEQTEQKIGMIIGLTQKRIQTIIKFCEGVMRHRDEATFNKIKAAELYREVLKDSAKLQVSAKKIIQEYSKMDGISINVNTPPAITSNAVNQNQTVTFIDEGDNQKPTVETGLNRGSEGTGSLPTNSADGSGERGTENDPEAVF